MSSASTARTNPRLEPTAPTLPAPTDPAGDEAHPHALLVTVGDRFHAIPVTQAREVIRAARLTRLPGAPPEVLGVVNVRGAVVTVLDLGVILHGTRAIGGASVVLIENGARLVGLAVDGVRDVRPLWTGPDGTSTTDGIMSLDAAALCARYLISAEEMGR